MEHFQYTNDEELNLSNKIYFEVISLLILE